LYLPKRAWFVLTDALIGTIIGLNLIVEGVFGTVVDAVVEVAQKNLCAIEADRLTIFPCLLAIRGIFKLLSNVTG
jgi:hypothetical protein